MTGSGGKVVQRLLWRFVPAKVFSIVNDVKRLVRLVKDVEISGLCGVFPTNDYRWFLLCKPWCGGKPMVSRGNAPPFGPGCVRW